MARSDFHSEQIFETMRMIEVEHLDIRTVTLGLSLLDLAGKDKGLPDRVYHRVVDLAGGLVSLARAPVLTHRR